MSMEVLSVLFGDEFLKQKLDAEKKFRSGLTKDALDELDGKKPITIEYSDRTKVDYKAGR